MVQFVYDDCYLMLAQTDFSAQVKSCVPNFNPEIHDDTVMGDTGKSRSHGLDDWSFDVELVQDFTNASVDDLIYAAFRAGTCAVVYKPNGATTGVNNPKWTGTGMIESYQPVSDGVVGAFGITRFRVVAKGTVIQRAEND